MPSSSSTSGLGSLADATLADLEAFRVLLHGGSIIDWHRLAFSSDRELDRFLRVNEFDLGRPEDVDRLEELRADAVEFLTKNFSYRIPEEVARTLPARELFLLASSRGRRQVYACMVLKVMHVMHHLAGRELLFRLPVSDDQIFSSVETKVVQVVEAIREAGYPIVEFAWSRKERDSVLTKLLAKKASIAAHVYDKLRFRLITRTVKDLVSVLNELQHRLIPFNYIIPGESVNGILPLGRLLSEIPAFARHAAELQFGTEAAEDIKQLPPNEFSGPGYRVINFVADLPVHIETLPLVDPVAEEDLGSVIFVLTEFQMMDAETARMNESGPNSHNAYKERQYERVRARLAGSAKDATDESSRISFEDHEE